MEMLMVWIMLFFIYFVITYPVLIIIAWIIVKRTIVEKKEAREIAIEMRSLVILNAIGVVIYSVFAFLSGVYIIRPYGTFLAVFSGIIALLWVVVGIVNYKRYRFWKYQASPE